MRTQRTLTRLIGLLAVVSFGFAQIHCSKDNPLTPSLSETEEASITSMLSDESELSMSATALEDVTKADLILTDQTITSTKVFESAASLAASSNVTIASGADVTFHVADAQGKGIVLKPGFIAREGSRFRAFVGTEAKSDEQSKRSASAKKADD